MRKNKTRLTISPAAYRTRLFYDGSPWPEFAQRCFKTGPVWADTAENIEIKGFLYIPEEFVCDVPKNTIVLCGYMILRHK